MTPLCVYTLTLTQDYYVALEVEQKSTLYTDKVQLYYRIPDIAISIARVAAHAKCICRGLVYRDLHVPFTMHGLQMMDLAFKNE